MNSSGLARSRARSWERNRLHLAMDRGNTMSTTQRLSQRSLARIAILAALSVGVAAFILHWKYGSLTSARTVLAGSEIAVTPAALDVGAAVAGTEVSVPFAMMNVSDRAIQIIGINGACDCGLEPPVPFSLEPKTRQAVTLRYRAPRTVGPFEQTVQFFSTARRGPPCVLRITGYASTSNGADGRR
jgi:Protein of unknown function (DUF1573)